MYAKTFNIYTASLNILSFDLHEVVVISSGQNYSDLFNLKPSNFKYWCLNGHFVCNSSDLGG